MPWTKLSTPSNCRLRYLSGRHSRHLRRIRQSIAVPSSVSSSSAIVRYRKEIERVMGVLDITLEGRQWLVGDKCTFADLDFFDWDIFLSFVLEKAENECLDKNYGSCVF